MVQNADMGLKKRVRTKADNPKIVAKNMFIGPSFFQKERKIKRLL